ncbi:MAG TPA: copper-binding protein [Opitutaceae bacterium]|nr:copper-binding protein [Opitutaceae bacterium]
MKRTAYSLLLLAIAAAASWLVLSRSSPPTPTEATPSYPLKGVVASVETDDLLLLVEHEDIPGFMPAMAMFFRVDAETHHSARAGQRIEATLIRKPESLLLTNVKLTTVPLKTPPGL